MYLRVIFKFCGLLGFSWLFWDISFKYFSYQMLIQFELVEKAQMKDPAVSICLSTQRNGSQRYILQASDRNKYYPPIAYSQDNFNCRSLFSYSKSCRSNYTACDEFTRFGNPCFRFNNLKSVKQELHYIINLNRWSHVYEVFVHEKDKYPSSIDPSTSFPNMYALRRKNNHAEFYGNLMITTNATPFAHNKLWNNQILCLVSAKTYTTLLPLPCLQFEIL